MIRLLTSVLLLGLAPAAFGQTGQPPEPVPSSPGAGSQSTPPTFPPGTARQERSSKTSASSAEKAKTFVGTVVKESTGYALRVKDLRYKLDDQQQASNYEGRNVRILGNLDKHANTIHVQSIEQF
jgi:hypothetical protein